MNSRVLGAEQPTWSPLLKYFALIWQRKVAPKVLSALSQQHWAMSVARDLSTGTLDTSRKLCQLLFLSLKDQLGSTTIISWQSGGFSSPSSCKERLCSLRSEIRHGKGGFGVCELLIALNLPPGTAQLLPRVGSVKGQDPCTER